MEVETLAFSLLRSRLNPRGFKSSPFCLTPSKALNGGLREGHTQVMILTQVMIMEVNEWLNGFFHRAHLDQSHFTVLPDKTQVVVTFSTTRCRVSLTQCKFSYLALNKASRKLPAWVTAIYFYPSHTEKPSARTGRKRTHLLEEFESFDHPTIAWK